LIPRYLWIATFISCDPDPFPSLNIDRKKLFVPFNPTYSYFWGNLKFILCKLTRRIVFLCKFLCFYLATVLPVKQFNIRTKHGRLYLSISKKYCSLNKFFIPFCSSLLSCFEYPLYCISKSRSLQGYDINKDLLTYLHILACCHKWYGDPANTTGTGHLTKDTNHIYMVF